MSVIHRQRMKSHNPTTWALKCKHIGRRAVWCTELTTVSWKTTHCFHLNVCTIFSSVQFRVTIVRVLSTAAHMWNPCEKRCIPGNSKATRWTEKLPNYKHCCEDRVLFNRVFFQKWTNSQKFSHTCFFFYPDYVLHYENILKTGTISPRYVD